MTTLTVTTQAELDAAVDRTDLDEIIIRSPAGVWLELAKTGRAVVRASGQATVSAYDRATIQAYGRATVQASGRATVSAYGRATVQAYDQATALAYVRATVQAYDRATVQASGQATVSAYGPATIQAYDRATIQAYGQATIQAYDQATVSAYDQVTVQASGRATVSAYGRATVQAGSHVAVHLHSTRAHIEGGVAIDMTALDLDDPATWCEFHGVDVIDGQALLYKAVDEHLAAGQGYQPTVYAPGVTVTAGDWRDDHECGGGLHVSQTPHHARRYRDNGQVRYLRVSAPLDSIRVLGNDKVKVAALTVLAEVDENGADLATAAVEAAL